MNCFSMKALQNLFTMSLISLMPICLQLVKHGWAPRQVILFATWPSPTPFLDKSISILLDIGYLVLGQSYCHYFLCPKFCAI